MVDISEKKAKIISFLESNGPSLPVRLAKVIEMEPVFAGAILSELYSDRKVKMSNMKVGSSSLFYLEGQEGRLQDFVENLKSVEKEAFDRIKNLKVLADEDEEPAIRVAIRGMKDFAIPFEIDGKIFWKFAFAKDDEIENYFTPKEKVRTEEKKIEVEKIEPEKKTGENETFEKKNLEEIAEGKKQTLESNSSILKTEKKSSEEKKDKKWRSSKVEGRPQSDEKDVKMIGIFDESNSDFYEELKKFLVKNEIKLIDEIQADKKEIVAKVVLFTKISNINYLLVAKNKKSINKDELNVVLQRSNYHKMPCLLILRKEPSKNIFNLIKETGFITLGIME